MLLKSQDKEIHLDNLQETFNTLWQYNMKLNPSKCAFGVSSGKFLGFMVSYKGIEANPDKIQAILNMKPPQTVKEVQSLFGRIERRSHADIPFMLGVVRREHVLWRLVIPRGVCD